MHTDEGHRLRPRIDRARTPPAYKGCEGITEALIYFSVIFTPWAFGTTQNWSVWTMNITCYLLGGALIAKWLIRWRTDFRPSRWGEIDEPGEIRIEDSGQQTVRWLTFSLAAMTVFMLAYCWISAWNARATFLTLDRRFEYHDYIPWLPHTYDRAASWNAFWQYLGLAFFFWAARDWLLGKTKKERQTPKEDHRMRTGRRGDSGVLTGIPGQRIPSFEAQYASHGAALIASSAPALPARLRRLLWVLCINGALLALEGILQRLDGTNKLLWLVVPRFNNSAEAQFGPYAYRSNAATYLNMLWPVCLSYWLLLRAASNKARAVAQRIGGGSYMLLLPCAVVMASAPIISTSRGGALIALAAVPVASGLVFFAARRERALMRASMMTLFLVILGFSVSLGWKDLALRLENMFSDNVGGRMVIYQNSRAIASQFPILGTGPASFGAIYQLYKEPNHEWEAYLHDDWFETRVTFGLLGFCVILAMLGLVTVRWFVPGGIPGTWDFAAFVWLAMGNCLLHAKFDFPFQIYSIFLLFLLLCSILFCVSRK